MNEAPNPGAGGGVEQGAGAVHRHGAAADGAVDDRPDPGQGGRDGGGVEQVQAPRALPVPAARAGEDPGRGVLVEMAGDVPPDEAAGARDESIRQ